MKLLIKLFILMIIPIFTSCIAPIIVNYENKFYTNRKTYIKIIPFYGDINQIYFYQQNLPIFSEFQLDEKYMYYNNNNDLYKSLDEERFKVFYLIISAKF